MVTTSAAAPAPVQTNWPEKLDRAAFHGAAGFFVDLVAPESEADPAALLGQFLVGASNLLGRGPYFRVEAKKHRLNLFAGMVGQSAVARKGTAWGRVEAILERCEAEWLRTRVRSGLSSGEGLITAVQDREGEVFPERRLLVIEEELASTLKVMMRKGSILSPLLRQAWDSGNLATLTKNPLTATGAHISIIGHITAEELARYLESTEACNGFGNRFLWFAVKRSQCLPEGGSLLQEVLQPVVNLIDAARTFAAEDRELKRDDEARERWRQVYPRLTGTRYGLYGAVTSRAEAQVLRLSCVYAVLDCSAVVCLHHLEAALAVWDFCQASAACIFGDSLGDPVADQICRALLATPAGLSRTDLHSLFGRNIKMERVLAAAGILEKAGRARQEEQSAEGPGRREVRWFAL